MSDKEPVSKQALDFAELGSTGLNHMAGEIFEEKLRQLQLRKKHGIYKEMSENDATIGAVLFAIDMLIRQVNWKITPATDSPEHKDDADFVDGMFKDMTQPFKEVISEILGSMLPHGHAPLEMVFKRRIGMARNGAMARPGDTPSSRFDDGAIGFHKLALRAPETIDKWDLTDAGDILGFTQKAAPLFTEVFIPIEKTLLFRTSTKKNNPEGRSVLRTAYRAWFFKKRIENLEAIGIERDLAGLPLAMVPSEIMANDASPEQKNIYNKIKEIVTNPLAGAVSTLNRLNNYSPKVSSVRSLRLFLGRRCKRTWTD